MLNLGDIYIEDCINTTDDVIAAQKTNGYESLRNKTASTGKRAWIILKRSMVSLRFRYSAQKSPQEVKKHDVKL